MTETSKVHELQIFSHRLIFPHINSSGVNKHICQMALRQLNTLNKADVHVDGNDCERLSKAHKDSGCIRIHRHM